MWLDPRTHSSTVNRWESQAGFFLRPNNFKSFKWNIMSFTKPYQKINTAVSASSLPEQKESKRRIYGVLNIHNVYLYRPKVLRLSDPCSQFLVGPGEYPHVVWSIDLPCPPPAPPHRCLRSVGSNTNRAYLVHVKERRTSTTEQHDV